MTGLDAPPTQGAINAVIPQATARGVVAGPARPGCGGRAGRLVQHLQTRAPWGISVSVTPEAVGQGVRVDTDGPAYAAARAAMHEAYGKPAQEIGAGGFDPAHRLVTTAVPGAEILLFGAQDPMARIHAPNESGSGGTGEGGSGADPVPAELRAFEDR